MDPVTGTAITAGASTEVGVEAAIALAGGAAATIELADQVMDNVEEVLDKYDQISQGIDYVLDWSEKHNLLPAKKAKLISKPKKNAKAISLKAKPSLVWKSIDTANAKATYPSKTALYNDVSAVPRLNATNVTLSTRIGNKITIKGIVVNQFIKNLRNAMGTWHTALIQCKTSASFDNGTLFMQGDGPDRAETIETTDTAVEVDTRAINRDKYDVLYHKKRLYGAAVNPGTVDTTSTAYWNNGSGHSPTWGWTSDYIPIEREVDFMSLTDTSAVNKIYLVRWGVHHDDLGGSPPANTWELQDLVMTYFKDTL